MSIENPFDEMRRAVAAAKMVNRACDEQANTMVDLLDGRLRSVSAYRLASLKKQLQTFNAHTGRWGQKGTTK